MRRGDDSYGPIYVSYFAVLAEIFLAETRVSTNPLEKEYVATIRSLLDNLKVLYLICKSCTGSSWKFPGSARFMRASRGRSEVP